MKTIYLTDKDFRNCDRQLYIIESKVNAILSKTPINWKKIGIYEIQLEK